MKKNLSLLVVFIFVFINNSFSQWTRLNSGTASYLTWLSFPTNDTGYVIQEDGTLRKTTNGGQTWSYVSSSSISSMDFVTVDTGLGCNWTDIYKTTNGGLTWTSVYHDPNLWLYRVFLLNHNTFFVHGASFISADSIIVLKSTDAGNSWKRTAIYDAGPITELFFVDQSVGYLGGQTAAIHKTTDGGSTWNVVDTSGGFGDYFFFSPDTGFGLGAPHRTTDGGKTWTAMNDFGNSMPLWSFAFGNRNIGFAVGGDGLGSGGILKTTDGGFNWPLDTPFTETFDHVIFTKNLSAFACGSGGIIVRLDARPQPDICFLTVDSTTGKNMIIWEKDHAHLPLKYKIFKESTSAGVYNLLDTVAGNGFSTYIDNTSNPAQKADRYKLSFVDSSNVESAPSVFQKTIHLTVSKGIGNSYNLIWDQYEGFSFSTYYILRGNYPGNVTVIDSVQSNLTSYTDLNPPANEIYYAIEVIKPGGCNPSFIRPKQTIDYILSSYGSSLSNIINRLTIGINELENDNLALSIAPNPATNLLHLSLNKTIKNGEVNIFNVMGEKVYTERLTPSPSPRERGEEMEINCHLPAGVYFVRVSDEERIYTGKVVVE